MLCVADLVLSGQESWFHGFLTYDEAAEVLRGRDVGTFLIRFSQSAPSSFAVAFVEGDGSVNQVLVKSILGKGFELEGGTCIGCWWPRGGGVGVVVLGRQSSLSFLVVC